MPLVTQCPACDKYYKVTQPQINGCNGRARCGHCGTVFNALDGLKTVDEILPKKTKPKEALKTESRAVPETKADTEANILPDAMVHAIDPLFDFSKVDQKGFSDEERITMSQDDIEEKSEKCASDEEDQTASSSSLFWWIVTLSGLLGIQLFFFVQNLVLGV